MGPMPGNYTRSRQPAPQTVHAVDIVLYTRSLQYSCCMWGIYSTTQVSQNVHGGEVIKPHSRRRGASLRARRDRSDARSPDGRGKLTAIVNFV